MKNVLFVTYYFPPLGGVGPHRVLRLLPHLKSLGWTPSVLTVSAGLPGELKDEGLMEKIPPEVPVYRTPVWDMRAPNRWLERIGGGRIAAFLDRWAECPPPDRHLGWLPPALKKADRLLKDQAVDVVVTVSAPYTAHLVGWLLKRRHHRPWVADLRDEWSDNPVRRPLFAWQARLDRWLESQVYRAADRILMTTPSYCQAVARRLAPAERNKVMLLTNGYDRRDFALAPGDFPPGRLNILYSGSLYGPQDPSHFLQALSNAVERGAIPKDGVRATFVGRASAAIQTQLDPWIIKGLAARIPYASHEAAVRLLMGADALLLLIGQERGAGNIPAKTFEYLAARKPILALAPTDGDTARLIQRAGSATIVDPQDEAAIEQALVAFYQRWASGHLRADPDQNQIDRYESRALAERFVRCLDGLFPQSRPALPEPADFEFEKVAV